MEKEISKGTQKFIWHMVSFVAVFIIALVVLCRFLPEPNRTATADSNLQVSTSQTDSTSTDFDSVKERVDRANNTTGKEVKSLYTGEGKSSMQKQLETRLFFNNARDDGSGEMGFVPIGTDPKAEDKYFIVHRTF